MHLVIHHPAVKYLQKSLFYLIFVQSCIASLAGPLRLGSFVTNVIVDISTATDVKVDDRLAVAANYIRDNKSKGRFFAIDDF